MSEGIEAVREWLIVVLFATGIVVSVAATFFGVLETRRIASMQPSDSPIVRKYSAPRTEEQLAGWRLERELRRLQAEQAAAPSP